jgi:quercetin dioxygenase-like cupin family protein
MVVMPEVLTATGRPVHIPQGDVGSVFVDALGIRYLLTGEDTGGHMTMLEIPCPPSSVVAPIHTHTLEDEFQVILEGEVGFELGGEVIHAKAGDTIVQPRGVPMAIWNPTDRPARLLVMFCPGGYDRYLKEVTPHVVAGNVPAMPPIWERYGLTTDPSSIPRLISEHGLKPQGGGPPGGGPPGGPPGGGPPGGGPPSGGPPSGGPPEERR